MYWLLLLAQLLNIPQVKASETINIPVFEDTYIEEKFPTVSPWSTRILFVGTDSLYGKGKTRILVKPELSVLDEADVLYTDVEKVELIMTVQNYQGTKGEVTIDTYTTSLPWSMFTVNWLTHISPSSVKEDSSIITTSYGKKSILVTSTFYDVYGGYPSLDRGIMLKINAETEKAITFWGNGCDVAQITSPCGSIADRPYFKITYRNNVQPSVCKLKYPTENLTKTSAISMEPVPSTDPDSTAPILYYGRVCLDIECTSLIWQGALNVGKKVSVTLEDQNYFLSCQASDRHQGAQWGDSKEITVDTVPPTPPVIIDEPLYTASTENKIFWYPETQEEVMYQVLTSERSDFGAYNTYSEWITNNSIELFHSKEKTFYYKVRSRDKAGNESIWSTPTSTVIDTTYPAVKYFKTNKTLLSPQQKKDGGVDGNAYIQGGSEEANVDVLRLEIRNPAHNVVYTEIVTDKSYLWTHWPEKSDYEDGVYFAVFYVADTVGHVSVSDPIFFTLDTTPPKYAKIEGISPGQTLSKQDFQIKVFCSAQSFATVYLSGKIIATQKQSHFLKINKKDGTYNLKVACTDEAANKSEKTLSFSIDTTPPNPPSLTYTHDSEKKLLALKAYCREDATVTFFRAGIMLKSTQCKKNSYATYTEQNIGLPYFTSFTANIRDMSGNTSDLAEKTVYLISSKDTTFKPIKITCSSILRLERKEFEEASCHVPEESFFRYLKTISNAKDSYASSVEVRQIQSSVITTTVYGCKSKTFWDPRTWIGCVNTKLQEIASDVLVTPYIKSSDTLVNQDKLTISNIHKKKDNFELTYHLAFDFAVQVGDETFSHHFTAPQQREIIVPRYESSSKAYFSWIFSTPKQVNQWHGNTVYEKPHSGVDFAVSNERILAPESGKVAVVAYHKASNCNSGGNYLGIKHSNGLYTYYFHLKSSRYSLNTSVKKGEFIATSGNSGMYNCEPLAAHLHFEVRTSMAGKAHINPVPYFKIDWNTIATAKVDKYPGRLSGENPHPKF